MNKAFFAGLALSSVLSAQAGQKSCPPDEVAVFSAQANAIVDCKPGKPIGDSYTHVASPIDLPETVAPTDSVIPNNLQVTRVLDSRYGNGGELAMILGDNPFAIGVMGQRLEHAKQVLATASMQIGKNIAFSAGTSVRSESARVGLGDSTLDNVNLNATNVFVRLDAKLLESIGLDRAAIAYIRTRVSDTALKTETTRWSEETITDMGSFVRYLTEYYERNRTTQFRGLDTNKLLASAVFYVGKNGEVTLHLGVTERDRKTSGAIGATGRYYTTIGGLRVVAEVGAGRSIQGDQSHQNIGARVALNNHVSVGAERYRMSGSAGSQYNTRASVMVSLLPNTVEFTRGESTDPLSPRTVVAQILSAPEYRISAIGDQGEIQYTDIVNKVSTSEVRDVAKEKEPEVKPKPVPGTPNVAPVANADTATVVSGNAVTVNVLANDSDANGDTLTISSTTIPQHGIVSISGSNIVYTSTSGYVGTDTFTYTVSDGKTTATATVTVNVTNTPRQNLSCTAPASQTFNDNGIDGQVINLGSITCQNTYGSALEYTISISGGTTASVDANGNITITSPNFDDGLDHSQSGTVTIRRVDDNNTTSVPISFIIKDNG